MYAFKRHCKLLIVVLALLAMVSSCAGCLFSGKSPGLLQFSPDDSVAAATWTDYQCTLLSFERSLWQSSEVLWCPANQPESVRSVCILSVGSDYGAYHLGGMIRLVFSPDSRHLAVVAPCMLKIIDLASGRCWSLTAPGEIVSSLAWLGPEEIGYAAHTSLRGQYQDTTDRTFWRQRIDTQPDSRVLIHREVGVQAGFCTRIPSFDWPLEHWSPSGRYALYQPSRGSQVHVLDSRERRVQAIGGEDVYFNAIAWKRDESAVACIAGVRGDRHEYVAMLINPRTLGIVDFTEPFLRALKDPYPYLQTAWTSDDRYLLINDLHRGGCVIQPVPFRCVRVADRLPSNVTHEPECRYTASIHPFPTSGWVRALDPNSVGYLVDCEGERLINLGKILGTWSDDGRMAGQLGYDKRFCLQRINLPDVATQAGVAPAKKGTGMSSVQ